VDLTGKTTQRFSGILRELLNFIYAYLMEITLDKGPERMTEDIHEFLNSIKKLIDEVPALLHTWRFAVGAVYAMREYQRLFLQSSPQISLSDEYYIKETITIIHEIRNNNRPAENWLRGFFYNAAVMRTDAFFERVFKAILNENANNIIDGEKLYEKMKQKYPEHFQLCYQKSLFGQIRMEVNALKHVVGGAELTYRENLMVLFDALKELLKILQDDKILEELKANFRGQSVVTGKRSKQ